MGNIENITQAGARFKFGGKDLKMIFINRAVKYLKNKYGGFMDALSAIDDAKRELDYDVVAHVLYAGFMTNNDGAITIEWITSVLDEMSLADTRKIVETHLIAAITGAYPEKTKGGDSDTPQK